MKSEYISSIKNLYGFPRKIPEDSQTIGEIIDRQGITFLLHCIAEYIGKSNLRFKYNDATKSVLLKKTLKELKDSINDRW